MNRKAVVLHLKEAKEELDKTILQLENNRRFGAESLLVSMSHLYHHLNTAWNGREASAERHRECSQRDFDRWRKFPRNADLLLD
jgi:hypothetical protein